METRLNFEEEIIFLIKEKSELKSLNDSYVKNIFYKHTDLSNIKKLNNYSNFKQCKRSAVCKESVSQTRKILRERYGVFIKKPIKYFDKKIKNLNSYEDILIDDLLNLHQSTFERNSYYGLVYLQLFDLLFEMGLNKNFSLGDFACGYNPLAYKFLPVKPKNYFACDLSNEDMSLINVFFKATEIKGFAKDYDLLSDNFFDFINLNSFDLVFLFKVLDSLETVKKNISKKFLTSINAEFLVVSFPLVSIGGKSSISSKRRVWFENFCKKQSWVYKSISIPNELFYVVMK